MIPTLASLALVVFMAFCGHWHGNGTSITRLISTIAFAAVFGYVAYTISPWLTPLGLLSMYGLMTGHGRFFAMDGANLADPAPEWIEKYIALPLFNLFKWNVERPIYSWFCMGVKGLMIGLAAAPFGLALAALWPLAYYISFKFWNDSAPAEWMTGACAGVVVALVINFGSLV